MFKQALVSVSDKTGLKDFLHPLVQKGLIIYSTGGTAQYLRECGFSVLEVSQLTGFPEVLDGRVKTLHPHVHMGLLAKTDNPQHMQTLSERNLNPFDLVVCNLYPFEAALKAHEGFEEMIEKIDIGGPTQLRAAAKNFSSVTVVVDPKDYPRVLSHGDSLEMRQQLAAKVFSHVSYYDHLICRFLGGDSSYHLQGGKSYRTLRYGENPQQQAWWYADETQEGLHRADILQGKELSYNNLLDLDAAIKTISLYGSKEAVICGIKHNNPCGIAEDASPLRAAEKMLKADPVSIFGGIVASNFVIDKDVAHLLAETFLECIIAPEFSKAAQEVFSRKKNLRILSWAGLSQIQTKREVRQIAGGLLLQDEDPVLPTWVGEIPLPAEAPLKDLVFAEKAAAALKSNAIAIVRQGQTLGLGMGQTNRVDAVEHAIGRALKHHGTLAGAVLASDGFFPFPDSVEKIAEAGIQWVLQPGGSIKDAEVLSRAKQLGVNMVMTGQRHFRH